MIQLQQCCPCGVSLYYCRSKTVFLGFNQRHAADFAMPAARLCRLFPGGAMVNRQMGGQTMIKKKILNSERIRCIKGGFSFIPHRFLTGGFFSSLDPHELLLYFLLVLAGDRNGISFYSYDKICTLLQMNIERYIMARDGLNGKDLIAFDGTVFQVLDLPPKPFVGSTREDHERSQNRDVIARLIDQTTKHF
jgi:hypothetical protein